MAAVSEADRSRTSPASAAASSSRGAEFPTFQLTPSAGPAQHTTPSAGAGAGRPGPMISFSPFRSPVVAGKMGEASSMALPSPSLGAAGMAGFVSPGIMGLGAAAASVGAPSASSLGPPAPSGMGMTSLSSNISARGAAGGAAGGAAAAAAARSSLLHSVNAGRFSPLPPSGGGAGHHAMRGGGGRGAVDVPPPKRKLKSEPRASKKARKEAAAPGAAGGGGRGAGGGGASSGKAGVPPLKSSDTQGGSSCHQCKSRRGPKDLTYCTSHLDKKKKQLCRKKYCEHCLKKFYKESPHDCPDIKRWACPSCRKICTCAACKRREARNAGKLLPPIKSLKGGPDGGGDGSGGGGGGPAGTVPPPPPSLPPGLLVEGAAPAPPGDPYGGDENARRHHEQNAKAFKLVYDVAQRDDVNKRIAYIVKRQDLTDGQKVESIASMLRTAVSGSVKGPPTPESRPAQHHQPPPPPPPPPYHQAPPPPPPPGPPPPAGGAAAAAAARS